MLGDCSAKENLNSAMESGGKIPTEFTEPGKTQLRPREAKERLALPISTGAYTVTWKENSKNCFSCR